MLSRKLLTISLLATSVLSWNSYGQSNEVKKKRKNATLPVIDVLGDEKNLKHTPGSATIITEEDLESFTPLSTQDVLRKTPGIHAVETDGFGFYPRITIRGLGADMSKKLLLLEDGAPIALGPFIDPAAYYHPPIERMESIEVLKGSGALRFGPSTIGGAINYKTRTPYETPQGRLRLSGGSQDFKNMMVDYGGTWGDTSAMLSVQRKEGDGWRDMPFEMTDIVAKVGTALTDNQYLSVKYTNYEHDAQHTYLGLSSREFHENYKLNRAVNDMMFVERQSLDINHDVELGNGSSLKTLAYWNNASRDWWREDFTYNAGTQLYSMDAKAEARMREFNVMGIDSRYRKDYQALGMRNELEMGVRLHREYMTNNRVHGFAGSPAVYEIDPGQGVNGFREDDDRQAHNVAAFLENKFHINQKLSITPGLRVENYSQKRDVRIAGNSVVNEQNNVSNTEVIPGIGANWNVDDNTTFFAGIHRGFAPPRVQDAIDNAGEATELDAERSTNTELGVRGQWLRGGYELTAFRLDFSNQLVTQTESGGAGSQLTNAGKTLNQGVEFGGDIFLGSGFSLAANYTWLESAELRSTRMIGGQDRNGNRLTYAPEHMANIRLIYERTKFRANFGANYVSEQFSDLENNQHDINGDGRRGIIPSYTIFDLAARYKMANNTHFFGAVRNLFDKRYIASRAPRGIFPGMGRMAELGVEVKF